MLETLEPRRLLSAGWGLEDAGWGEALPSTCTCPFCGAPPGLLEPGDDGEGWGGDGPAASDGGNFPLTAVPVFNSRPGAHAKLVIQFNGASAMNWQGTNVPDTPAFTLDGDAGSFSGGEIAAMLEILHRVAEKYSPFNINVTTVDPGNLNDRETAKIIVGGNGNWLGQPAGGVAFVGGFSNANSNIGWAFSGRFGGNIKAIAEVIAHEAGHLFGLQHQSRWVGNTRTQEYNDGDAQRAPIMGNSYSSVRGLWWLGPTPTSATAIQDDMWRISHSNNGFGYRPDDHGNTAGTATSMTFVSGQAVAAGVIEQTTDVDAFSFTVPVSGTVTVNGAVAQFGPMLDLSLELYTSSGTLVASAATPSLGETITTSLPAGSYVVLVRSAGQYGDVGQFTLTVTVPQGQPPPPPVAAVAGTYSVSEGGTVTLSASPSTGTGLVFTWDLDGDGVFGETGGAATRGNETGMVVTFNAVGLDGPSVFNVTLRVTDVAGQVSTLLVPISVLDVAPTVTVGGAAGGFEGSPVTVTFTATDPGGVHDPVTSWLVNWGDGTTSTFGGSVTSATKVYTDDGNYVVTITAVNKDASTTVTRNLSIANVAPTLTLTTSVPGGGAPREGSPVQLHFTATDPGADTISQWVVEWGDGTTNTFAGTAGTALRTYLDNGTYLVRVTAVDEDGSYTTTTTLVVENVAPTLSLTASATRQEGTPITFTWSANDPGADTISQWRLEWGDGTTSTFAGSVTSASKTYADNGTYTVRLTAVDEDGSYVTTLPVTVANVPPTITWTAPATVTAGSPYTVQFSASDPGTDTITQWVVEWGDGTTTTLPGSATAATRVFTVAGNYTVTLRATDEDGTYAVTRGVQVTPAPVTVSVSGSASPREGSPFTLSFSASSAVSITVTSWTVTWGDGTSTTLPGSASSANKVYGDNGEYLVRVTAVVGGQSYMAEMPVSVANVAPTLSLTASATRQEGTPITFTWSATDPGADTISQWRLEWGDGTTSTFAGSVTSASKTYADNGTYTVRLTAWDEDGSYVTTLPVTVANVAPTLNLTAAASRLEGMPITFTWTATDPGADTITQWRVEWGDGTTSTFAGSVNVASKTYADDGTYTVRLTAWDEDGSYVTTLPITVANVAPTITLTASPNAREGTPMTLSWSAFDPGADTISQWRVEWGDGTTSTFAGSVSSASKTYADDGQYLIRVTATDEDGNWTRTLALPVADVAPTLTFNAPSTVVAGSSVTVSWSAFDPGADTITQWEVLWGDGSSSVLPGAATTAMRTFTSPGSYVLTLRATNEDGVFSTTRQVAVTAAPVSVTITPPPASAGPLREGTALTLGFSASSSVPVTVSSWTVAWGDGTTSVLPGSAGSAVKAYGDQGSYTVRVTAMVNGTPHTAEQVLTVANVAPTITLTASPNAREGTPLTLSWSAFDPGADTISQWRVEWGDGTTSTFAGSVSSASKTYADDGEYLIRVTATDEDGNWTQTLSVTVANVAPTLTLTVPEDLRETVPFTLGFRATDPGTDTVLLWRVEWGDGTTSTYAGSMTSAVKAYADDGTYLLRVTAVDEDGAWTVTRQLSVGVSPPVVTLSAPASAVVGQPYTVSFSAGNIGNDPILGWVVDWGDGVTTPVGASANSATRTWLTAGTKTLRVYAIDSDGTWSSAPASVTVSPAAAASMTLDAPSQTVSGWRVPVNVSLSDPLGRTVNQWQLSWNGGQSWTSVSSVQGLVLTAPEPGQRVLSLRAALADGTTLTASRSVQVWAGAELVQATAAPVLVAGSTATVHFTGQGLAGANRLAWRLVWSDGFEQVLPPGVSKSVRDLAVPGEYSVRAVSVHPAGEAVSSETQICVVDSGVMLSLVESQRDGVRVGEPASFELTVDEAAAPLLTGWRVTSSEGVSLELPASARQFVWTFGNEGVATLTVQATFGEAVTVERTIDVAVLPTPSLASGAWSQIARGLAQLQVRLIGVPSDAAFTVMVPSGATWPADVVQSAGDDVTLHVRSPDGVLDARDSGVWAVMATWGGTTRTLGELLAGTDAGAVDVSAVSGGLVLPRATAALPSGTLLPGSPLRATARVAGGGATHFGTLDVGFYLSQDTVWDGGDTALGGVQLRGRLAVGAVKAANARLVIPTGVTPGVYHVLAVADGGERLVEPDERNNVLSLGQVTVVPPVVDLSGSRVVQVQTTRTGQVSAVRLLLSNSGNVAARDVRVRLMLMDADGNLAEAPVAEGGLGRGTLSAGAERALRLAMRPGTVPPGATLVAVVTAGGQSPFATTPLAVAA